LNQKKMAPVKLNRENAQSSVNYPVKVLQFGEGNFLRAFVDWIVDILNEKTGFDGSVQVVQPLPQGMGDLLNSQEGLYHVILQGIKNGRPSKEARLIQCVKGVINPYQDLPSYLKSAESGHMKFIISNTTESGIAFSAADQSPDKLPDSFPGKLTLWLHRRFEFFGGDQSKGMVLLPCELIEKNGEALRNTIIQYIEHWKLSNEFKNWILKHNTFCNTLVDRIVPGFPKENIKEIQSELGFEDQLVVTAEPFHLWVIEGPEQVRKFFPADQAGLQVVFTNDLTPYRSRKVRILNGAHTAMVPVAYLKGLRTVREAMEHREVGNFIKESITNEIIPTLDLPDAELKQFAHDVTERFLNPFIKHELLSIALNSISKFEVRVLPSIITYYQRKHKLPVNLVDAFAALLVFYRGKWNDEAIPLNDSVEIIEGFRKAWAGNKPGEVVNYIASLNKAYKEAFSAIPGLATTLESVITKYLKEERQPVRAGAAGAV
jgi:tagaturonate reductase